MDVAAKFVKMAQKGAGTASPELTPWALPKFAPVRGHVHRWADGRPALALVKYSASGCSKVAAAAEVEARGLIPQATKALNVKLLKRSDAMELASEDRKAGFPTNTLEVDELDLSWTEVLAQAEKAGLAISEWETEGHDGRRFGRLLLHFAALRDGAREDGDRAAEDTAAEAPAPAPAPAGPAAKPGAGLLLTQEEYDALVLEGMALGVDFSERSNTEERAAVLYRLVKAKRKASASPAGEGSAKKPASEADLAALSSTVETLMQAQAADSGNANKYAEQFQRMQEQLTAKDKGRAVLEKFSAGQLKMAMSAHQWKDEVLAGQYNALEPLFRAALESGAKTGDETMVKAISETMDTLVVANKLPDGTQMLFKVLKDSTSEEEQQIMNKFESARKKQVLEAKNNKILGGYDPYGSMGAAGGQPGFMHTQFGRDAASPSPMGFGFGGGQAALPPMAPPPMAPPMGRGRGGLPPQQLQLGNWMGPPPGPPPGAMGTAQGVPKRNLQPQKGPGIGNSRVMDMASGQSWPLKPMSAHNHQNPGMPVRSFTSPVRSGPAADGARGECQICGEPAGPGGHLVFECPTARAWMQMGWVDSLCKPLDTCPRIP